MKKVLFILLALSSFKLFSQEMIVFYKSNLEFQLIKVCNGENCEIIRIEILKDGQLTQAIIPDKNYFNKTFPNDQLFVIEDMNFDEKLDFRLMEFIPAGPNIPYLYWIFNPTNQVFQSNENYGEITSPEFDHEKEEINSTWRNGCCEHGRDVYKLKDGIPMLEERFVTGHASKNVDYHEHWKVENGVLKLIEKETE